MTEGKLQIGSAMQTLLIKKLIKEAGDKHDIILYDAPPGTSCPVVAIMLEADYVVLVTEPTPFGLHDLKISIEVLRELSKPFLTLIPSN